MKASEVLAKYAAGERDFRRVNLQGQSFKNRDLSGSDFSGADIRGTNFTGTNLTGVNFSDAKAGLQKRSAIGLTLISFLMAGCSGVFSAWVGFQISLILDTSSLVDMVASGVSFFAMVIFFIVAIRRGLVAGFGALPVALALAGAGAGALAGAVALALALAAVLALALAGAVALTLAGAIALLVAVVLALAGAIAGAGVLAVGLVVALAGAVALKVAVALALALVILSAYLSWRAMKGDSRDAWIRTFAIAFAATGGTSFRQANLTDAYFTRAKLKNTDFRGATLTRTFWRGAEKLDMAFPGNTYLKLIQLQPWLTGVGQEKNFDRLPLRGVNLQKVNLTGISFIGTDLCEANLQDADLSKAKLVQTQLDHTDLTGATLTGAFIEEWNITSDTKLDGIKCDYVYMRLPPDKRPHWLQLPPQESLNDNPSRKPENWKRNFKPGEFADFIAPMVQTLDLYHNQAVDPRMAVIAYNQLRKANPDAELELISLEKKGKHKDKLLLRSETKPQADHGALSAEYFANLDYLKSLPSQTQQALLAERGAMIRVMADLIGAGQKNHLFINNQQGDTTMNNEQSTNYDLRNAKFGGGFANRDQSGGTLNNYSTNQDLTAAAAEIQGLLDQLSQTNSTSTHAEKIAVVASAIDTIESNPTLKARVINALKIGGTEALREAIDHPLVNILLATIEGWHETER